MRMFSGYGEDDDNDVDFMYQAGRAGAEETQAIARPSGPDISRSHPGVWKLFRDMAPRNWTDGYVRKAFTDVVLRYTEEHRGYHNLSHLEDLASQFEFNQYLLTKPQVKAVRSALVFHDVIYECQPGTDEKISSDYAARFLKCGIGMNKSLIGQAQEIILATASHKAAEDDLATRLFLDMDMSILGSRPDIYAHYVDGVRKEFCIKQNLTPEQFDEGRAKLFLIPVLEGGTPIFTTEQYRELEPLARSNMRRELAGAFTSKRAKALRR